MRLQKIRLVMHLRAQGITDTRVLSVFESVPREAFLPPHLRHQAYEDIALPIGHGQTISQPQVVATMTQALKLGDRDKVLEIGTGSGYQTAILCRLCRRVYSIERHKPLLTDAESLFQRLRLHNITAVAGDGMLGWPAQAPFDKIICTAAARDRPPPTFLTQLRPGGILVVPVAEEGGTRQMLRLYKKEGDDTYAVRDLMPVRFVPLLPSIADTESDES